MTDIKSIFEFNRRVIKAHNNHYINNIDGLIDMSKNANPSENQIYHLYSNGEITYQKGAWAYLKRSEFNLEYEIPGAKYMSFSFLMDREEDSVKTYAILTKQECLSFREQMKLFVRDEGKKFQNKEVSVDMYAVRMLKQTDIYWMNQYIEKIDKTSSASYEEKRKVERYTIACMAWRIMKSRGFVK